MKELPGFNEHGDLPAGIYTVSLEIILARFSVTPHRAIIGRRLERIYALASSTGGVARFIIFGSFITAKPAPNDG